MIKIKNERVAYFDCDYTLIDWDPIEGVDPLVLTSPKGMHHVWPMAKNIALIHEIRAVGWEIVVWSQGGADHAERVIKLLNLEPYVDLVMAKPSIYVDDMPLEQQVIKRVFKK